MKIMDHVEKARGTITCPLSGSGYAAVADVALRQRIAPGNPDWAAIDAASNPWVCGCCKTPLRDAGMITRAQQAADAAAMQECWDFGTVSG